MLVAVVYRDFNWKRPKWPFLKQSCQFGTATTTPSAAKSPPPGTRITSSGVNPWWRGFCCGRDGCCGSELATLLLAFSLTTIYQHGGRDERESVEKVSKVRDVGWDHRVHRMFVRPIRCDAFHSIALVVRITRLFPSWPNLKRRKIRHAARYHAVLHVARTFSQIAISRWKI